MQDWSSVADADVDYDRGAPVVYADLAPSEILALSRHSSVAAIYLDEPSVPQGTSYIDTIRTNVQSYSGLNKRVCVIEAQRLPALHSLTIMGTYCGAGVPDPHGQHVTGIVRSGVFPYGVAKGSATYFANWAWCDQNAAPSMWYCKSSMARAWNFSHTCSAGDNRLFDYYAVQSPYPTIVVASGNTGSDTAGTCPATCSNPRQVVSCEVYNGLVVGGGGRLWRLKSH